MNWQATRLVLTAGALFGGVGLLIGHYAEWASLEAFESGFVGIKAGEWLQASAAFIGVPLTILGTLKIEEVKRKREIRAQFRHLEETLRLLSMCIKGFEKLQEKPVEDISLRRTQLWHFVSALIQSQESLDAATAAVPIRSFNLWSCIRVISGALNKRMTRLKEHASRLARGAGDTESLVIMTAELRELTVQIGFTVETAINEVKAATD